MKKQIVTISLILAVIFSSCDYPYFLIVSGETIQSIHIADSAYFTKSKKLISFKNPGEKQLEFSGDTMRLISNGVFKEVVYIKSRIWLGKEKYGTQILTGMNTKRETKSIRVHVKNIKQRGHRMFITSEIMDGEYNVANDTIWTYYKPNPD